MSYDTLSPSDVALLNSNNRNNDGFGGSGSWWIIIFLIFAFMGWGGNGFGRGFGYGSNGGTTSTYEGYTLVSDFSQLSRQLADSTAMTERKLDGINNGLCSGFYQEAQLINGVNSNIASSTAAVQSTLTQGFAGINTALVQNGYETRGAVTDVGYAIKDCCCTTQRNIDSVKYENAQNTALINNTVNAGFTGVQQAMCLNTRDIIDNQNANFRALHDEIVANKIEAKNDRIAEQQNEINSLRLSASQCAQNQYLINQLRPCPQPCYITCNPWGCNCGNNVTTTSAGCNCGNY